jgi:hypothetical protein
MENTLQLQIKKKPSVLLDIKYLESQIRQQLKRKETLL